MARVAITGATGQLGRQLVRAFTSAGHEALPLSRAELDLDGPPDAGDLRAWRPDIVVNSAAWTDVDGCARDPGRAMRINGEGAGRVAEMAASSDARVVHISTNEVFDGTRPQPYSEADEPNPVNAYGRSKLAGERAVAAANPRHVIIRTAWLFGPGGTNFVTKIIAAGRRAAAAGEPLRLVEDEIGNPTWTPDLADVVVGLATDGSQQGIVHAAGNPAVSRLGWARVALEAAGIAPEIQPVELASFERASTPPMRAVLAPSVGMPEMDWRPVTRTYVADLLTSATP
jgi:dTDP-4-dehydrorhamnose reductase